MTKALRWWLSVIALHAIWETEFGTKVSGLASSGHFRPIFLSSPFQTTFIAPTFFNAAGQRAVNLRRSSGSGVSTLSSTLDGRPITGALKPLLDHVLIEKKDWEKQSEGGVLLSAQSRKEQSIGKVLAAGEGAFNTHSGSRVPMQVKVGDWVVYTPYGDSFKYNGRECVVTRGDLVQGVIQNSEGDLQPGDMQPLGDSVFVKLVKPPGTTDSGLILSVGEKTDGNSIGEVLSVGRGTYTDTGVLLPMEVAVGDKVQFPDYAASNGEMKIDGERFALVRQRDITLKW